MDPVVLVGPMQHVLWDRIPGSPAKLQQPRTPPRRPHLRGQEPGGAVSERVARGFGGKLALQSQTCPAP